MWKKRNWVKNTDIKRLVQLGADTVQPKRGNQRTTATYCRQEDIGTSALPFFSITVWSQGGGPELDTFLCVGTMGLVLCTVYL